MFHRRWYREKGKATTVIAQFLTYTFHETYEMNNGDIGWRLSLDTHISLASGFHRYKTQTTNRQSQPSKPSIRHEWT